MLKNIIKKCETNLFKHKLKIREVNKEKWLTKGAYSNQKDTGVMGLRSHKIIKLPVHLRLFINCVTISGPESIEWNGKSWANKCKFEGKELNSSQTSGLVHFLIT